MGDVQEVIDAARQGRWKPAHVIVGSERFLAERAIALLRAASVGGGPSGFNDDVFHGGAGLQAESVRNAARTLPMMAEARFVLVRDVEQMPARELDELAAYLSDPSPSTCLVLSATKLDGRIKLAQTAKKNDQWAEAQPLKGRAVRAFATREAKRRGHRLEADAADALVDAIGEDLAAIDDALERLSLYVGDAQPIDLRAVEACVTRVRTESIWALVDAVSMQDGPRAIAATSSMLSAREPPLRILAMVARQLRMVARMRQALASGQRTQEAAKQAGAPPFKARDMAEAARRFTAAELKRAFATLSEADQALKGSKRSPETILEEAILRLSRAGQPAAWQQGARGAAQPS